MLIIEKAAQRMYKQLMNIHTHTYCLCHWTAHSSWVFIIVAKRQAAPTIFVRRHTVICTHLLTCKLLFSFNIILTPPRWSSKPFQGHSFTCEETHSKYQILTSRHIIAVQRKWEQTANIHLCIFSGSVDLKRHIWRGALPLLFIGVICCRIGLNILCWSDKCVCHWGVYKGRLQ